MLVLALSVTLLLVPENCWARERTYNVPEELRFSFISAHGRYKEFHGIDCIQPLEMKTTCGNIPLAYKWHWNHETTTCERIPYYGCEPTRNNFYSQSDCMNTAGPVCIRIDKERYKHYYDIE